MLKRTHIWPEEPLAADGHLTISAVIESPGHAHFKLWYRFPSKFKNYLSKTSDFFTAASIFHIMKNKRDTIVHGQVSPSLLQNLEEFQLAWSRWLPQNYSRVDISADTEKDLMPDTKPNKALACFSGGLDSCFTVFRHSRGTCGRWKRNLNAALMVHGFDIPLDDEKAFANAANSAEKMLESISVPLIRMSTNFKDLGDHWTYAHSAGLASTLMALQNHHDCGLIGSTQAYESLAIPGWSSNPITDHLLSSESFKIVHDGAGFSRDEKIREISAWPEAIRNLRVCWEGELKDRNCGRCEKCIRTIIDFKNAGLDIHECFERDITENEILNLKISAINVAMYERMLSTAKKYHNSEPWVKALEKCVKHNKRMIKRNNGMYMKIRRIVALRTRIKRLLKEGKLMTARPSLTQGEYKK
jgi:hypothetical protein